MATLDSKWPTLLDHANRTDPDGSIAMIAEILDEVSEVLDDIYFIEGNLVDGNKTSIRNGLPTPTWRKMYGGVQPTKSRVTQVTDTCGMLEDYGEVDKALADTNGNTAEFRLSEDKPHIEGINQELTDTIFHGNEGTEPEAFTGLSPRYNSLSAENADNIIVGGGSGADNGSIWLVVWSDDTCFGIIPKGSQAGLQFQDLGEVTLENVDGNGGRMQAYRSHYRFDAGLTLKDWRYVVRIPNIDKSLLSSVYTAGAFASGAHLPELMFQAMERIPNLNRGKASFYMSRTMRTWVRRQVAAAVQGSTLETEIVGGKLVERFHGIPLKRVDALAADETLVA